MPQFPDDVRQRMREEATRARARILAEWNPIFAAALTYHGRGLHPMPINPDSKIPHVTWREHQERRPTVAELLAWWQQWPRADLGLITGRASGIVVVDEDTQKGGSVDGLEIPSGCYIERTRSGGLHYAFRHPGQHVGNTAGKIRKGVDVRGDGGYFKVFPSPGYTVEAGTLDPATLPLPPAWVHRGRPEETRQNPLGWFEALLREPAPEGQRNDRAARLAGYLLRRGLTQTETLAVLTDWWARCVPGETPFPESELVAVVASIATREAAKAQDQPVLQLFRPRDLPDVAIEFAVDSLVPKGTLSVLFGPDKEGKTLLTQHMVQAVRRGEPFLGRFAVLSGPVIMLLLDDPPALTRERLVTHLGLGEDDGLFISTHLHANTDNPMRLLDALREEVLRRQPVMVVLDALYVLLEGAEQLHLAGGMRPIMRKLDKIAEESGAAMLLVHHARRADQEIAGSFVIRASAKSILRLTRPRDKQGEAEETTRRLLRIEGKFLPEAKYALDLVGPGQWRLIGEAGEIREQEFAALIVDAVEQEPGLTGDQIADRINKRKGDVARVLRQLERAGRLRVQEVQTGGRPKRVWFPKATSGNGGVSPPTPRPYIRGEKGKGGGDGRDAT